MMLKITMLFSLIFILLGCNSEQEKLITNNKDFSNISYIPNGDINLGYFDSSGYNNDYFGFSISDSIVPWFVINKNQFIEQVNDNKDRINMPDEIWEEAINNNLNLITFEKENPGEYGRHGVNIMAEGLDLFENVNDVIDYFDYSERYFEKHFSQTYPKYKVIDLDTAMVGNKLFLVQSIKVQDDPNNYYFQKTYSAQYEKHLLNIHCYYNNDKELKQSQNLLNQIMWK